MTPELTGALVGGMLGLLGYAMLNWVAGKIEHERGAEGKRTASILRYAGIADFIILTLLGGYLGPIVLSG